ncbi:M20 family peptidase [Iodidimonas muriae]|nr:M20 family peptidase [Iodidimonas muriae]
MMRIIMRGVVVLGVLLVLAFIGLWLRVVFLPDARPDKVDSPTISLDGKAAIDRLAQAIRFETVSTENAADYDAAPFADFHAFLKDQFPLIHQRAERHEIGRDALLFGIRGTDAETPAIVLMAHQDVVPVEPGTTGNWIHPPFGGVVADGYIWGRGTLDDKGSLMAIMEALEYLLAQGFTPKRSLWLAFGADEELGGDKGAALIAQWLAEQNEQIAFVLDEGLAVLQGITPGIAEPVAMVGLAEKGSITLRLRAESEGGHSSMPPMVSAPGRLSRALARLESTQMPASLEGVPSKMLTRLAPHMAFPLNVISGNLWLTGPVILNQFSKTPSTNAMIRTTTAITMLQAGFKSNVLAQSAEATINFRIRPNDTGHSVIDHVRTTIDDPAITIIGTADQAREATKVSSTDSAAFHIIEKSIAETFPKALIAPGLMVAATDSRHFTAVADDVYRFAPMRLNSEDLKRLHGTNERVSTENYLEMIRFYVRLIENSNTATRH